MPDEMIQVAVIDLYASAMGQMTVYRDSSTLYLTGGYRLDLDGIGQLQVALDLAVTQIRTAGEPKCKRCGHVKSMHAGLVPCSFEADGA